LLVDGRILANNNGSGRPKTYSSGTLPTINLSNYKILCHLIDDFIFSGVILLGDDLVQFQPKLEAELVKLLLRVDLPQGLQDRLSFCIAEAEPEEPI
jgi:hypothetical protein